VSAGPARWVTTLFLAEGLPYFVITNVAVLMYIDLGLTRTQIALVTSTVAMPWALKPLWSPFLEMLTTKKPFVVLTQLTAGVAFACLALCIPLDNLRVQEGAHVRYTLALLWLLAFNAATHDIAADGLYIAALDEDRQARFVGLVGASFQIGRILAQGALVWLAGTIARKLGPVHAWMVVMGLVGVIMTLLGLYHAVRLPAGGEGGRPRTKSLARAYATFFDVLRAFLHKRKILWALAFVLLYRTAEGQLSRIVPLFLREPRARGGLGLDLEWVGALQLPSALAYVAGSIIGGMFVARRSSRTALLPLCLLSNAPILVYPLLAWTQTANRWLIGGALGFESFAYGFGSLGVMLFMLQQIAPGRYQMAHYAFATSFMSLGLLLPGLLGGWLCDLLGFTGFFVWVTASTLPSVYVVLRVGAQLTASAPSPRAHAPARSHHETRG
jgi:MFS transporter, PAT family, beta-lactamase induction signal transducer AmpG